MNRKRMPKCTSCGGNTERNEKHDAYHCKACDQWSEKVCSDSTCEFCAGRPEKPSEV